MASFKLEKGNKFNIDKGIKTVVIGLGWKAAEKPGVEFDVDAHAFGCVVGTSGVPSFYNDGSHAVTYANESLKKDGKAFGTHDDSMKSILGDNRNGKEDGDDEQIRIIFDKLPSEINEILIFVTIHEAKSRNQHFGDVSNSYVSITDTDTGRELCRYDLQNEFHDSIAIQMGSLIKNGDKWNFTAVGAGTPDETLGDILQKLS